MQTGKRAYLIGSGQFHGASPNVAEGVVRSFLRTGVGIVEIAVFPTSKLDVVARACPLSASATVLVDPIVEYVSDTLIRVRTVGVHA